MVNFVLCEFCQSERNLGEKNMVNGLQVMLFRKEEVPMAYFAL